MPLVSRYYNGPRGRNRFLSMREEVWLHIRHARIHSPQRICWVSAWSEALTYPSDQSAFVGLRFSGFD